MALDCPPSTTTLRWRASELIDGGDAVEQFEVGVTLRSRGERELGDRLICLSAHQGLQNGQAWMAHLYRYGYPPHKPNLVQAYKWYAISYKGSLNSIQIRDYLAPQMTPAQIAEAERLVSEWEPNPAECEAIAAQADN
jgi:TPR repeat protein